MPFLSVARALAPLVAVLALAAGLPALANGRVALLIGNNNYPSSPLRNAVNDSRDLAAALRELGFKTIVKENTTRAEMIGALQEFGRALEGADAALFFYAGHAMQFKDRNYLIPIDAVMGSEDDVTFFSVEVSQVFDRMERARTRFNFVVLDACRDNPFRDTFKVSASGLAQMSGPSGTLIAYATAPGATAADGFGRNGVYTGHLLQNIKIPDMPVEVLFRKVREGVERDTKRLQTPWELSSIKGDFVFNASGRAASGAASSGGPSADVAAQLELQFWKAVQDSTRPADLQAYLEKYPNGLFAVLAKNRIETLVGRGRASAALPPAASPASPPASTGVASAPAGANLSATRGDAPPSASVPAREPAKVAVASVPASDGPSATPATPTTAASGGAAKAAAVTDKAPPSTASPPPVQAAVPAGNDLAVPVPTPPRPRDDQPGREIAPGVRELTFADGSVYRGAMRGVQLHGKGEYVSKAFKYDGEFRDGMKHGIGRHEWENGDRYEGEFADDRPNGKGKYQFGNGDAYEGEVKAGVIAGRGIYRTKGGDQIEGTFVEGRANGTGIYRFASGDRYEGEMAAGRLQGKGRYYSKSGDRIEGAFADGRAQGPGVYHFANGDRYEGELKDGAIAGQGAYFHASGSKYEGQFVDGRAQGKGTFWFQDGSRFEGVFENGITRARGEVIRADGTRSPAEMVDGAVRLLPQAGAWGPGADSGIIAG